MSNGFPVYSGSGTDPYARSFSYPCDNKNVSYAQTVNGAATANTWYKSGFLSDPKRVILYIYNYGAASTLTLQVSPDGTNWFEAMSPYTSAAANFTMSDAGSDPTNPAAGGTISVEIVAANYYRVKSSVNLTNLTVNHASYNN